jgi:hypothetical protein
LQMSLHERRIYDPRRISETASATALIKNNSKSQALFIVPHHIELLSLLFHMTFLLDAHK